MLQQYCPSLTNYKRLATKEVKVGDLMLGNNHPIRIQTMTTTDTMDTEGTVAQCIRSIQAGAELVRITAPSKKEAENLLVIKNELRKRGYNTPLIADIHFTPNAAEIAARVIEKVRINPGNYIDKKKFDFINYTDSAYNQEIDKIRERFTPLVNICKEYGTAMRIGTNHGSLSDRIMSRFGDSPIGMVESAMEFLRIARDENYHQIILSMKSSNPQVMVHAYRLLVQKMDEEFGECYPLHLGVTEAGDGEDGRIKSAIGIGTLLEDGIGDTIRVSLTEDPEFEIPVCRDIVKRYEGRANHAEIPELGVSPNTLPYNPFSYKRRTTENLIKAGATHHPVVVADFSNENSIKPEDLYSIGYHYDYQTDKWNISDAAADFIYLGKHNIDFALPGTLSVVKDYSQITKEKEVIPNHSIEDIEQINDNILSFLSLDVNVSKNEFYSILDKISRMHNVILCLRSSNLHKMASVRNFITAMMVRNIKLPVILVSEHLNNTIDEQLIKFSTDTGGLFLDGFGDGIWLKNDLDQLHNEQITGRTYLEVKNNHQFLNNTSFSVLQATRTRISKTEYISCPSCGRTLFDLQETTAKIRSATYHLKGVKIAIMGCIVNGPGEMADADFGYVGSGPGKITLYKGKDVMKKNVPSEIAVDELIQLLKENEAWIEPSLVTN